MCPSTRLLVLELELELEGRVRDVSLDTIFACIFHPFSTQLHFTFLTPPFSFMFLFAMFLSL